MPDPIQDMLGTPTRSPNAAYSTTPEYRPLLGTVSPSGRDFFDFEGLFRDVASAPPTYADYSSKYVSFNPYETDYFSYRQSPDFDRLGYVYGSPYNRDRYYQNQGTFEGILNAASRFYALTIDSFVNNFAQYGRDIDFIKTGQLDKLWDSDLNKEMHDRSQEIINKFPIYSPTGSDGLSRWIPFTKGSLSAYGDLVGQLGFTAGTIGATVIENIVLAKATGLVGNIAKAPKTIKNVYNSLASLSKLFNNEAKFVQGLNTARQASTLTDITGNIVKKGINYYQMYHTAASEAAFEAMSGYAEQEKELTDAYIEKYGYGPTGADLENIRENAKRVGNATFGGNVAVLTLSNAAIWGNIIRPYKSSLKTLDEYKEIGRRIDVKVDPKTGSRVFSPKDKLTPKTAGWWLNGIKKSYLGMKGAIPEGLEEASQNWIITSSRDYFTSQYDNPNQTERQGLLDSIGTGFVNTFGTTEGWDQFIAGALTGIISGGVAKAFRAPKPNYTQQVATAAADLNRFTADKLFNREDGDLNTQLDIKESIAQALEAGDIYTFKNLKEDAFRNFVLTGIYSGKLDVRLQQLQDFKNMSQEQFEETFGIDPTAENRQSVGEYVDGLVADARRIEQDVDLLNRSFPNPYNPSRFKKGSKEFDEEVANAVAYSGLKDRAAIAMDRARKAAQRAQEVSSQAAKVNKDVTGDDFLVITDLTRRRERLKELREFSKTFRKGDDPVMIESTNSKIATLEAFDNAIKGDDIEGIEKSLRDYYRSVVKEEQRKSGRASVDILKPDMDSLVENSLDYLELSADADVYVSIFNYLTDPDTFEKALESLQADAKELYEKKRAEAEREELPENVQGTSTPEQQVIEALIANKETIRQSGIMGQTIADNIEERPEEILSNLRDQASNPEQLTALLGKDLANKIIALGATTPPATGTESTAIPQLISTQVPAQPQVEQDITPQNLPATQTSINTPATKVVLDHFADTFKVPRYTGDLSGAAAWLQSQGEIGTRISRMLNTPKAAYDIITQLASQPVKTTLKDKKADIEKRRQEELSNLIPKEIDEIKNLVKNGNLVSAINILYQNFKNQSFISKGRIYKVVPSDKYTYSSIIDDSGKTILRFIKGDIQRDKESLSDNETISLLSDMSFEKGLYVTKREKEINAKYDAELAVLEQSPTQTKSAPSRDRMAELTKRLQEYKGDVNGLVSLINDLRLSGAEHNALNDIINAKVDELNNPEVEAKVPTKYSFSGVEINTGIPIVISINNRTFAGVVISPQTYTNDKGKEYIQVKTSEGQVANITNVESIKALGQEQVDNFMAKQKQPTQGESQAKENEDNLKSLLKDTELLNRLAEEAIAANHDDIVNDFLNNDTTCQ